MEQQKPAGEIAHHESPADDVPRPKDAILDAATRGQGLTGFETMTPFETFKKFKWCTFYAAIAAFAAGADGYQIACVPPPTPPSHMRLLLTFISTSSMNSGILANPGFLEQFATLTTDEGKPTFDSVIIAAWGSIIPVGQVIAQFSLPFLAAPYGRKNAMYACWIILTASIIGESLSTRWEHWLVAKLFAGMGLGCVQITLPTYVAEVAPVRVRGILLMTYNMWWTIGQLFAYVAMESLSNTDSHNWLVPIYTQWFHIGLMAIIFLCLPESPAWAVSRGKIERARKSLSQLYRGVDDFNVDQQIEVLVLLSEHEATLAKSQGHESWFAVFRGIDGFRTLVALWTISTQQFNGMVLFASFGAYFFQQAGVGDPFQIKCITLGIKLAAALLVVYFADSLGRRSISCSGTTAMWGASLVVGILGVVPRVPAVNHVFIFMAVIWSESRPCLYMSTCALLNIGSCRYWIDHDWSDGMGLHW